MKNRASTINEIRQHTRQLVRELHVIRGVYLDSGYTFTQCHVLFELGAHKSLNLMSLVDNLLLDKSNTSRTVKSLVKHGLVKSERVETDQRQKLFALTTKGKEVLRETVGLANKQVEDALDNLSTQQQELAIKGMQLYANALSKSRMQSEYTIRLIQKRDNAKVAQLIREVMIELEAVGEGFSIGDPEVDDMYNGYRNKESCYYVIALDDKIVGCGGIAPLEGGNKTTCELRKMFLLAENRGIGLGRRLLLLLLKRARSLGYDKCYLETKKRMSRANELYRNSGFQLLEKPVGKTGHCSCDSWYLLDL